MKREDKYRHYFSRTAKFSALLIIFILVVGWINEGLFPPWKQLQGEYRRILRKEIHDPVQRKILIPEQGVYQVKLVDLKRTDRCITCHLAMEGSLLDSLHQPFIPHPGKDLIFHPVREFGCTVCHGGQGQALDKKNAFAQNPRNDWDQPILESPFIESSCGKCHLSLFSPNSLLKESKVLDHGRNIFLQEGCLGCHKARGVGGMLGPDLTAQGDKSKHEYKFRNIKGKQTISNWLEQHFVDPEMVSPGSRMLRFDLPKSDLEALATCVMGLSDPKIPYEYIGLNVINELKGMRSEMDGEKLYEMICSACHGKIGEGKPYETYKYGVPAIGQPGFLAIVSREYIAYILHYGRTSQLMTSWAPEFSGLSGTEVADINKQVLARRTANSTWDGTRTVFRTRKGSEQEGFILYTKHCRTCHGNKAKGGLALGFNHPDFFAAASLEYLYHTLFRGRGNTAMPSWSMLSDQEMADLLTYINGLGNLQVDSWQDPASGIKDLAVGAERFHYLCSRCHGDHGEGATGPAILNHDFLQTADDHFLYQTISHGRAHTPMHGWIRPSSQDGGVQPVDVYEIIKFMRSCADTTWVYNYPGPTLGNREVGKILYATLCSECHGTHGTGLKAPSLNDQVFLNAATNGFLLATMTLGRPGTPMPVWGTSTEKHEALTDQQRNDLVAYIRSWQLVHLPVLDNSMPGMQSQTP